MMYRWLFLCWMWLGIVAGHAPATAQGVIYHVAVTGDDANDGSSGQPWRTLQHAVDTIAPGDTIWVHAGTYAGARIENSGAAGGWKTLQAAPGETAIINAPGPNNAHGSLLELERWSGRGIHHWIVQGLEVTGGDYWGIDVRGSALRPASRIIVRDNRVHNNGWATTSSGIFTAFTNDSLIENNESYANGEHGIYWSNSGDRPTIRGNRLYDNQNCGLHMNADLSQGGDGLISGGIIENNQISNNGLGGCAGINMDGVAFSLIRNNLLYENHAGGIALFRQDGAACSHDIRVFNNTIVQAVDGRWAINITDSLGSGAGCVNNQVLNNIIYNQHPWRGSITIPLPGLSGFVSDYNVVMDRFSADDDNSIISLAEWQGLGYDLNSFIATPEQLFVNPAGQDYHLKVGSPARDAGLVLSLVPFDIEGVARPQGAAYDIGAYEALP